jgi:hypothetical protein
MKRVDNSDWKKSRPAEGDSGAQWKNWAKKNPNRESQAIKIKAAAARGSLPTTMTTEGTKAREKSVEKWKAARPESGARKATDAAGANARRQNMIAWAKWNPNKLENAQRAIDAGKQAREEAKKAKKATKKAK